MQGFSPYAGRAHRRRIAAAGPNRGPISSEKALSSSVASYAAAQTTLWFSQRIARRKLAAPRARTTTREVAAEGRPVRFTVMETAGRFGAPATVKHVPKPPHDG